MPKDRSSRMAPRCWGLAISVLVLSMSAAAEVSAALRAGVAAVNITADKPTEPVHDPLMAKALVLEDGGNRVVIISMDIVVAEDAIVSAVRRGVQQELGIDPSLVLLNASHNHRTEDQEAKDMVPRIVAAVKQASQNMVAARIGSGVGQEDRITENRRLRTKDGKHWAIRRATPSPADADVIGMGPLDPQIGLLRVDTLAGKPLAVVYNFAGHAYGGVPGGGVTADFPGFASRVIEKAWPGAVALFLQAPPAILRLFAIRTSTRRNLPKNWAPGWASARSRRPRGFRRTTRASFGSSTKSLNCPGAPTRPKEFSSCWRSRKRSSSRLWARAAARTERAPLWT